MKTATKNETQKFTGKDSVDFYESIFDAMFDGLAYCQMIFDEQGNPVDWIYLQVNKNFEKLTGLKNAEGKKVTELIPGIKTSNPELFEIYGRVSLGGKQERFETYVEPLARWFLVSVFRPQKGFFVAIFQNITDEKQKDKDLNDAKSAAVNVLEDLQVEKDALALINARDEAILANIGDGLVVADLNRRVIFLNVSGERMLGYEAGEVLGKDWFDVVALKDNHGQKIPLDESLIQRVLTTTTTTTTTDNYFYTKKDGSVFPVSITASKISIKGELVGVIAVFRDISKEKEVEKLRMDFLSLASHQLRTPLSGTKWLIETLNRKILGPVTEKQKEYLDQIYQINERMIKLVFDMLNALRFESGEALVKKETISIPNLYEEVSLMTASAAKDRGVELHNVLENHTVVVVETDVVMLRSILETFISNAINYSERGQEIFLDAKEETTAIVFFVKDNGIGIPKEEQGKIFERFYRSSNAKAFKPDGTGLGLYIASMLAEKIGAKIWFESEINKGTTFYLRVPKKVEIINNPINQKIDV